MHRHAFLSALSRCDRGRSDCAEAECSWRAAGDTGAAAAATLWSLSERLVQASLASEYREDGVPHAVVLAGKEGAWREIAEGEAFGPGHTFSVDMTSGRRFVQLPTPDADEGAREGQHGAGGEEERSVAEEMVQQFVETRPKL